MDEAAARARDRKKSDAGSRRWHGGAGEVAAEAIVRVLAEAGVRRLFGLPGGGSNLELIEAGRPAGLEFILCYQEGAAAILAATEAELTGRPGVCLATLGPGATSSCNGVAHAFLDRVPLLLFTDRHPDALLGRRARQQLDHARLFAPIAKASLAVRPGRAAEAVRGAIALALAPPRGPVHLDLPADVALAEELAEAAQPARTSACPPAPDPLALGLARSRRPICLVGLGAADPADAEALLALVEALGAPTMTTYKAKGAIPEDHPLAAGPFAGGTLEEELVGMADLILAVGLDPVEPLTRPWPYRQPIISLAEAEEPTDGSTDGYPATIRLAGPVAASLEALRLALPARPAEPGWGAAAAAAYRAAAEASLRAAAEGHPGPGLAPHRVVEVVRSVAPRDAILAVDSGAHMFPAAAFWPAYAPRSYLCSSGLATMGYAVPAALAAKLVHPARPVLAFTGDGGLMLNLPEVAMAVRLGLAVAIVVFHDRALSLIKIKQVERGYPAVGLDLPGPDPAAVARALGADGWRAETEEELAAAAARALAGRRPAVIAARVNPAGYGAVLRALRG